MEAKRTTTIPEKPRRLVSWLIYFALLETAVCLFRLDPTNRNAKDIPSVQHIMNERDAENVWLLIRWHSFLGMLISCSVLAATKAVFGQVPFLQTLYVQLTAAFIYLTGVSFRWSLSLPILSLMAYRNLGFG